MRCDFVGNSAADGGGAVAGNATSLWLYNCSFVNNSAANGGGVYMSGTNNLLVNCTFLTNACGGSGGGLKFDVAGARLQAVNNIFFGDKTSGSGGEVYLGTNTIASFSYCVLDTNKVYADTGALVSFGSGITNANPLFARAVPPYDVHLKSQYGRWTPGGWVNDAQNSPCIDAGDSSDYALEPNPNGGRINMGAYGNTPQASKSRSAGTVLLLR